MKIIHCTLYDDTKKGLLVHEEYLVFPLFEDEVSISGPERHVRRRHWHAHGDIPTTLV
jgi:hypothetical protein